jgi:hypothetical protein
LVQGSEHIVHVQKRYFIASLTLFLVFKLIIFSSLTLEKVVESVIWFGLAKLLFGVSFILVNAVQEVYHAHVAVNVVIQQIIFRFVNTIWTFSQLQVFGKLFLEKLFMFPIFLSFFKVKVRVKSIP